MGKKESGNSEKKAEKELRKKSRSEKKEEDKGENFLQKTWHFIWYSDTFLSWLANVVIAFVIIKFLVYPVLGMAFGTSFPIVAVVSKSMEHNPSGFDAWWSENKEFYKEKEITKSEFENYPFTNGFNRGDIMILMGESPEKLRTGDILVYRSRKPYPIIHRVVSKRTEGNSGRYVFQTKGDNNKGMIVDSRLDERNVEEEAVVGKAALRLPYLGYVKIWFVELMKATKIYYLFF